jgi:hypothetical protein
MNVFVLCTGCCGSATFIKACSHISNFTAEHESRTALLGADRLRYPPNHIEADNRLAWLLGRLDKVYGDSAFYVHLKRDTQATAASYVKRYAKRRGIMKAYRCGILLFLPDDTDPLSVALDYCETVNSNIELFLKDKSHVLEFCLERAPHDFAEFCRAINAVVDIDAARAEFGVRYNASSQ